jgi:putative zinc finger protein
MSCRAVVELATEHFEGSLPAPESERFVAHVAHCEGCQAYLRQLRITADIAHTAAGDEPLDTADLLAGFRQWRAGGDADADANPP